MGNIRFTSVPYEHDNIALVALDMSGWFSRVNEVLVQGDETRARQLVPAGEWDPSSYTLRTYLNGDVVQEGGADDLIWPVSYQLADLCRLITLEPGDIVLTGTPANSSIDPGGRAADPVRRPAPVPAPPPRSPRRPPRRRRCS